MISGDLPGPKGAAESARPGARPSRVVSLVACTMGIIGTVGARPVRKLGEILAWHFGLRPVIPQKQLRILEDFRTKGFHQLGF